MLPWPFCFWTAGPGTGVGSTFATMAECELGVELFSFAKVSCITLMDTFWTPNVRKVTLSQKGEASLLCQNKAHV